MISTQSELINQANTWVSEQILSFHHQGIEPTKADFLAEAQQLFPSLNLDENWLLLTIRRAWRENRKSETHQRTLEQWAKIFPRYPIAEDGFALAFKPEQSSQIVETMQEFGLVVVHVLNPEECLRSRQAILEEINTQPRPTRQAKINWEQPWTWEDCNWAMNGKFLVSDPAFHQQAFNNRTHETIYQVYSTLWNQTHLQVNVDLWGIYRGTCELSFPQPDGSFKLQNREDWRLEITKHWDHNPWLLVEDIKQDLIPGYQGFVALANQDINTGCHLTLPGSHRFLEQWCVENTPTPIAGKERVSGRPMLDDPILEYMQPIPLREGDLMIFSWGQLHSALPNHNSQMRLHQYMRMFPAVDINPFYAEYESSTLEKLLPQYSDRFDINKIELSDLGRKLLGLESWV
ncbi:MAG: phytanoyl-CoA dioxygenase family protein [Cyanobacteria bacterium J06592_8]